MKNSDVPANPTPYMDQASASGELYCDNTWLSKREKFAAMAMQGLLSNSVIGDAALWGNAQEWIKQMTETSVEMADTLLIALDKEIK